MHSSINNPTERCSNAEVSSLEMHYRSALTLLTYGQTRRHITSGARSDEHLVPLIVRRHIVPMIISIEGPQPVTRIRGSQCINQRRWSRRAQCNISRYSASTLERPIEVKQMNSARRGDIDRRGRRGRANRSRLNEPSYPSSFQVLVSMMGHLSGTRSKYSYAY